MTTTRVIHASPAGAFGHVPYRSMYADDDVPSSCQRLGLKDLAQQFYDQSEYITVSFFRASLLAIDLYMSNVAIISELTLSEFEPAVLCSERLAKFFQDKGVYTIIIIIITRSKSVFKWERWEHKLII